MIIILNRSFGRAQDDSSVNSLPVAVFRKKDVASISNDY